MQRVFIAIDLSPDVRWWLEKARSLLETGMPAGAVRWVDINGIHITLKFLGEIPTGRINAVRGAMDRSVEGGKSFPLSVEGMGCFPNNARPRVVWAGVRSESALLDLQRRLEENLSAAGFPRERRAFSPHLTLGRVRDGANEIQCRKVGSVAETTRMETAAVMKVEGVFLFRSVLHPKGPEYSVIYRAPIPI